MTAQRARSMVMLAMAMANEAMHDGGYTPWQRVQTLTESHGLVMAAHGPGEHISFAQFRELIDTHLQDMLPSWVEAADSDHLRVVDDRGYLTDTALDALAEDSDIDYLIEKLHATQNGRVTLQMVVDNQAQERMFTTLRGRFPDSYTELRRALVENASLDTDRLKRLALPDDLLDCYTPIRPDAVHHGLWWPCPVCAWPMRVTHYQGSLEHYRVACADERHAETGASYLFTPSNASAPALEPAGSPGRVPEREQAMFLDPMAKGIPQALPVEEHRALKRGVWKFTVLPGLCELRMYQVLSELLGPLGKKASVVLWPGTDSYDLRVQVVGPDGASVVFRVDVKDYRSGTRLAEAVDLAGGDKGGAEWLVVPDHRSGQVDILSGVCADYRMRVATATGFINQVCRTTGIEMPGRNQDA
ncbi:hypothetical protein ABZ644_07255 [Nocardiopsis alba]|uniref:restriction endonuclease-related protein n=1 Tax=Nocardiopsis alba TaxID=53437 RepID=UPI003409E1BB